MDDFLVNQDLHGWPAREKDKPFDLNWQTAVAIVVSETQR